MKIALLTNGIWPFDIGGMQKHSYLLCKYLARNKVEIDLYYTTSNRQVPDLETIFNSQELKFIRPFYIKFPISDHFPGHYIRSSLDYSNRIFEVLVPNLLVDIIYAKGLTSSKLLEEKAKGMPMPPVCINVHGYEYYQKAPTFKEKLQQYLLRPAFRLVNERSDYIFSYGGKISQIIRKRIRNSFQKIIEIPAALEDGFISDEELRIFEVRHFVFLGRFERRKGIQELLEVAKDLLHDKEFQMHFIGDIPEKNKISLPSLIFHGVISNSDNLKHILQSCDVLICPSYSEGMPNVVLEGMAAGCAVIATDVGAMSAMVSSSNGWLIKPGAKKDLKKAMIEAISMNAENLLLKRRLSIAKVKAKFIWEKTAQQHIDAFSKIISI